MQRVLDRFEDAPETAGLTGLGRTDVLPYIPWPKSTLFSRIYYWSIAYSVGVQVLWGANMALRASAWESIRTKVHKHDSDVHEDQDISLLMWARGLAIDIDHKLLITTSGQQYRYLPKAYEYTMKHFSTKQIHTKQKTLQKAQDYALDRTPVMMRFIVSIPLIVYVYLMVILFFPLDYVWAKLRPFIYRSDASRSAT